MNIVVKDFFDSELKTKIETSYENSLADTPNLLLTLKRKRKELEETVNQEEIQIINLAQFSVISHIDFQILLKNFLSANNTLEINFYARVFAISFIEYFDGLNPLLGKDFRKIFSKYIGNPNENNNLQHIYNEIKDMRKENESSLRHIRNNVIGHRDANAQNQMTVIENIDTFQIMQLNLRVVQLISKIKSLLSDIVLLIS